MIALTLVGLMVVLLFSGLRLGSRSWDTVEARAGSNADMNLVRGFIERSLTEMHPALVSLARGERVAFGGQPSAIEFVTPMGGYLGSGGMYLVRLRTVEDDDELQLVLQRWLFNPLVLGGDGDIPAWEPLGRGGSSERDPDTENDKPAIYGEHILFRGLDEVVFSYFGRLGGERAPEWHDEWQESRRVPLLVGMRLRTAGNWWPDLVVALPTGQPASTTPSFGGGTVSGPTPREGIPGKAGG
jgi:general secretion pathway protein J